MFSLACVIKMKAQSFLEEVPGGIKKRATTRAPAPPGLTSQLSSPSLLRRQIYWQQTPTFCPSTEPCLAGLLISFTASNILTETTGIRCSANCQCYTQDTSSPCGISNRNSLWSLNIYICTVIQILLGMDSVSEYIIYTERGIAEVGSPN